MGIMCGLCGEVKFNGTADPAIAFKMANRLQHRGPDAGGVYSNDRFAFGHRRLKILDLSSLSSQPLIDGELGLALAFNGCIYNFKELREELTLRGHRFFSGGDTEVIAKAYREWGTKCVERFQGMFAFAIMELASGRLVLARDRLGIKPMYIAESGDALRFASTLQALLVVPGVDTSIDPVALHHYMSFHAVVPAPLTIFKGIRKLPAGTILTVEPDGTRSEHVYWSLGGKAQDSINADEQEILEEVREKFRTAVRRRTVADVPTGVLLSGGLDSSLIVGMLADQGKETKTFSIGFDAVNGLAGDEFQYSDIVARHFGTDHHRIVIDGRETVEALPGAIAAMSEPMMSHDCVAFYLLSREVSKCVKVVQSGQGADEVFGGYHWYPKLMDSNDPSSDYAALYFDRDHNEMLRALDDRYLGRDYSGDFVAQYLADAKGSGIDRILQLDTSIMLVDDPVKRVDNMTMAYGLEARVPFLDHELVEFAARIPAPLKVGNGGKYILKEAARGIIPDEVIDRPKGYFPVPALKYIQGPVLDFVNQTLTSRAARERGIFKPEYVESLLREPESCLTPKGHSKLWQVAVLEAWLQTNGI